MAKEYLRREFPILLLENRSVSHFLNYVFLFVFLFQAWRNRAAETAFVIWGALAFALFLDILQRVFTVYTLRPGMLYVRQGWRGAAIPVDEIRELRSCPGGRNLPVGRKLRAAITTSNLLALRWGPKGEERWAVLSPSEELVHLIRHEKKKK